MGAFASFFRFLYFMHMDVFAYMYARYTSHVYAWYSRRPEDGIESPRNGVSDGCELKCRCWESNLRTCLRVCSKTEGAEQVKEYCQGLRPPEITTHTGEWIVTENFSQ